MKALSLREPWASLIAQGVKLVETRSWNTRYRGPLYIHASLKPVAPNDARSQALIRLLGDPSLYYGRLVARCVLLDCVPMDEQYVRCMCEEQPVEYQCGEYRPGRYAWLLGQVERLEQPVAIRGSLGLWNLPDGLL